MNLSASHESRKPHPGEKNMLLVYAKTLFLQGGVAATVLVSSWLISLYINPAVFGQYSLYLSVVSACGMLFINWPNAALLRFGREEWNSEKRIGETLAASFFLYFMGTIVAIGLAWRLDSLAARFLDLHDSPFFWIALGVILLPLTQIGVYANQATGQVLPYSYAPLLNRSTFLSGIVLVPLLEFTAEWNYLVMWGLAGTSLASIVNFWLLPRCAWHGFRFKSARLKQILRYSWAIPLGAVAAYTVNWVDAWVIRGFMDSTAVGLYTWAYQVTMIGNMAFAPLGVILAPAMLDARLAGDIARLGLHGHHSLRLMITAGIVGLVILTAVYPILSIVVGSNYLTTYPVVLILLSAIPFQLLGYLMNPIGSAFEHLVSRAVLISVGVAVLNVLGDVLLVPQVGIMGAAIATLIVFSLSALLTVILLIHYIHGLRFPSLLSFGVSGLLMPAGSICLLTTGPLLGAGLCIALSVSILLAIRRMGVFSPDDVKWLEVQPITETIKKPLVSAAIWLSRHKVI